MDISMDGWRINRDRQTDRQTDKQTDSQKKTDRQTDTHTDRQTGRQADRQKDRYTDGLTMQHKPPEMFSNPAKTTLNLVRDTHATIVSHTSEKRHYFLKSKTQQLENEGPVPKEETN